MPDIGGLYATIAPFLTIVLFILFGVLTYWTTQARTRVDRALRHYRQLTSGVRGGPLDNVLEAQVSRIDDLQEEVRTLRETLRRVELMQIATVQRVGIVRFNPFNDVGGNQSFAIALLDGRDNGIVLSSLFVRESTRIYAKPVRNGESDYPLTDEEVLAIDHARNAKPLLAELETSAVK